MSESGAWNTNQMQSVAQNPFRSVLLLFFCFLVLDGVHFDAQLRMLESFVNRKTVRVVNLFALWAFGQHPNFAASQRLQVAL